MQKPNLRWDEYVDRVVIHSPDYLTFKAQPSYGGRQRYIKDIASIIKDVWNKDVLIVQKAEKSFEKTCDYGFRVIGIPCPLGVLGDPVFAYRSRSLIKKSDGVLYAAGEDSWPFAVRNSKSIQHGIWWDGRQSQLVRSLQKQRALHMLDKSRSVLCVDTNFINWTRSVFTEGLTLSEKCIYIPNYAEINKIPIIARDPGERLNVLCARRFEEKRGLHLFVEAVSILRSRGVPIAATICSPGERSELCDLVAKFGVSDITSIYNDDFESILARYQTADVTVVPTIWSEGTSLSCVESICAGVPVVSTPVGGLGNLIIPGFNGVLVQPSGVAIADGIMRVSSPQVLSEMSKNCLSLRSSFDIVSWKEQVNCWLRS